MTTQAISTLQIKPLVTHHGESGRHTSITSFEAALQTQKETEQTAQKTSSEFGDTSTNSRSGVVTYKDPSTGSNVQYVESQGAKKTSTPSTGRSKSVSNKVTTTTASSMKTTPYDSYFKKAAKKYGVDESLLKGIAKAESNFNPKDVSSSGAMGIMQLMPDTARGLGVDDPFDPEQNIMGGAKCIAQKLKEFQGNVKLALAAYNAGSGTVRRTGGIPSQCKSYISKVLSYQEAFKTAKKS